MNIIFGLPVLAIGAAIVIKSESMLSIFGRIGFFEKYLGVNGGSRLGYKLIGIFIIFIGILITTNMIGGFLAWLMSPLTRYNQPLPQ